MVDGTFHLADEAALDAVARALAEATRPPLVVTLSGPLGAGKTSLARAWLRALGYQGAVRSPTYTLIESYPLARFTLHHLDLYRVGDPEELEFLGIRDLVGDDAVWLVEWPERGGDRLPAVDWALTLDYAGSGRSLSGWPAHISCSPAVPIG